MAEGQRLLQQVDVAGGQCVPQQGHLQRVVGKLAFVRRDVLHHFVGVNDGFGFEQHAGRGNPHHRIEGADQGMCLRQVFAVGAQLFPDEGHGVHAQDIYPQIGDKHHFAGHGAEYPRVAVVQIPLERVKRRPYPAAVPQLGERAGMLVGEDFAYGAVVLVGHPAVGEDVVEVVVHRVAGGAGFGPFVFVGGVVEDEIHYHGNSRFAQCFGNVAQIFDGTQRRIDFTVAADGITAVALAFGAFEQRHQVQVGKAELFEIGNGIDDAA